MGCADGWYADDLRRAASLGGEQLSFLAYEQLYAEIDGTRIRVGCGGAKGEIYLDEFAAVLPRSIPPGSLEQVVLRVDLLHAAAAAGVQVCNGPRTLEVAIDKWLTLQRLAAAGLPVPRTAVCQRTESALEAFERLGSDVVVKPLFGGEGRGLMRISDPDLAWRSFRALQVQAAVIYLQEYIDHGAWDTRVFILGERSWSMRRFNGTDWRKNVARGGQAVAHEASKDELTLARAAAAAVGADMLGVDILHRADGTLVVIEVNAVPGWRALNTACRIDVARAILDHVTGR